MNTQIVKSTADIVLALANANRVGPEQVVDLIKSIYTGLKSIESDALKSSSSDVSSKEIDDINPSYRQSRLQETENKQYRSELFQPLEAHQLPSKSAVDLSQSVVQAEMDKIDIQAVNQEVARVTKSTTGSLLVSEHHLGVFPDRIICLEDKKECILLKSYIRKFSLTPKEYRKRWNLPDDYPMVPPAYLADKRKAALNLGLGRNVRSKSKRLSKVD